MPTLVSPTHLAAPAVAIIDQNGVLTLSFTPSAQYSVLGQPPPVVGDVPSYTDYDHWLIRTTVNAGPNQDATFLAPVGYSGGSLTFTETLVIGTITLTMAAFNSAGNQLTQFWNTSGTNLFPGDGTPRTF